MTFPQFNKKHLEQALFEPGDFVNYKKWDKRKFPKKVIITYQRSLLEYFKREYAGKYESLEFVDGHKVLKYGKVGFIKMAGIGSTHAATVFEELIALGAKEFINIGTAGGLDREGLFLCNKAIRDEGTSHHYLPASKYVYPDKGLTERLGIALNRQGLPYIVAPTWTVDAPYRETKAEIARYKKEGVATVEMEASALFAVAKVRKVDLAAAFVVSDVLGIKKWKPKFHTQNLKRTLNKLVDASILCLGGKTK